MPTIEAIKNWITRLWPKKTPPHLAFLPATPPPRRHYIEPSAPWPRTSSPDSKPAAECPTCLAPSRKTGHAKLFTNAEAARAELAERMNRRKA